MSQKDHIRSSRLYHQMCDDICDLSEKGKAYRDIVAHLVKEYHVIPDNECMKMICNSLLQFYEDEFI